MKIALIGYGKMGHMIEEIALQRGHEIVCKIDVNNPEDIDSPEFCSADVAIERANIRNISPYACFTLTAPDAIGRWHFTGWRRSASTS